MTFVFETKDMLAFRSNSLTVTPDLQLLKIHLQCLKSCQSFLMAVMSKYAKIHKKINNIINIYNRLNPDYLGVKLNNFLFLFCVSIML